MDAVWSLCAGDVCANGDVLEYALNVVHLQRGGKRGGFFLCALLQL